MGLRGSASVAPMTTHLSLSARFANATTALLLVFALVAPAAQLGRVAGELVSVIVRGAPGAGDLPERLVESNGGTIDLRLPIIHGFSANVPRRAIEWLTADPAIESITPNLPLQLQGRSDYSPGADVGSILHTTTYVGANRFWSAGFTGKGVDVAMIDSGVSPVLGLNEANKLLHGPDLSFESQAPNLRHLDTFGHGTFMAGLIAGHDTGAKLKLGQQLKSYVGMAPGARIVSVKVADAWGATDVSQVIAGIDWVVQHRRDAGLNIRVLNLSFGTYSDQPYALDPLAFAAEVAWHSGIFVVVAAGNNSAAGRLMDPAMDPWLMAVGADDPAGTMPTADDVILAFSARGDGVRNPDLVAPGKSLQGLRVPGSRIDLTHPEGRINDRYFRGSGTSQAAALVSGAAALVIQQRPAIQPDQLKALLTSTAQPLPAADVRGQGAGLINLDAVLKAPTPASVQSFAWSSGTGSLELARGGHHLVLDGVALDGERDIFGHTFDSAAMAGPTVAGSTWNGGVWNGSTWAGSGWSASEWSASEWSASEWSSSSWSGHEWSSYDFSASEWSASEWSASEWSASEWSASEWSASEWSASEWSASEWSTSVWATAEWR
jgi:subtilisin family serine protease